MFPLAVVRALPDYKLACTATGTPPIYTAIIRNASVLVNTTNTATIILNEEGNYTCVVTSKYGIDVREFAVIFTGNFLQAVNSTTEYFFRIIMRFITQFSLCKASRRSLKT